MFPRITIEQHRSDLITGEELAAKLDSPHADKVLLAKDYTKADLRRDLLATMADASREHIARYPKIRARLAGERG